MGTQSLPGGRRLSPDQTKMLRVAPLLLLLLCLTLGEPQNNFRGNRNNRNNNRRPARQNNARQNNGFLRNGVTRNGSRDRKGTEVYPGCDGKVCLPEASLCAERQNKVGHRKGPGGKSYWFSWDSDEATLSNARWNWFTARNYCRKRCMDLISIENQAEQNFIGQQMARAGVREVWSSGRLCDKEVDGCDQPRFQPYNIRGWFWAATLATMARPTCSMAGSSMDGPTLVQMAVLSQMVSSSRTDLVTKLVWLFWTTSSMTVSNGTIPSVTTDVTSSAKISLLAISTLSDNKTPMLSSLEQIQKEISHGILGIFQPWKILALKLIKLYLI